MKKKVLFICPLGLLVGFGHYKRCHHLALEFHNNNWDVDFIVITNERPKEVSENYSYIYNKSFSEFLSNFKFNNKTNDNIKIMFQMKIIMILIMNLACINN